MNYESRELEYPKVDDVAVSTSSVIRRFCGSDKSACLPRRQIDVAQYV